MKSGTILAKTFWVLSRLGPLELLKRARRYFKNYKIEWLWLYRNQERAYKAWLKKEAERTDKRLATARQDMERFSLRPLISVLMPVPDARIACLDESVKSLIQQAYPLWELIVTTTASRKKEVERALGQHTEMAGRFRTAIPDDGQDYALHEAVSLMKGEFIGFLDCGDVLAPHALLEVVGLYNEQPDVEVIYSDEDHLTDGKTRSNPFFKPDWSPDLLLSMNYINHFFAARRRLFEKIRDEIKESCHYDLVLRLTEQTDKIVHIPEILYHSRSPQVALSGLPDFNNGESGFQRQAIEDALKRRGLEGEVLQMGQGRYRVNFKVQGEPLVSIIIPVRDNINLLRQCLHSIKEKSTYRNYEIIVVDNGSVERESFAYFKEIQRFENCRVVSFDQPFNYSRINNFAAGEARGDYLLFLNNDTEVLSPGWLEEMLAHCQRPETGAVGAKLLFPDDRIQHAGVIVGLRRVAMHAFYGLSGADSGYMGLTAVLRNYAAVTAACMMMPKNVFYEACGFDEELAVAYNDVDLCLRVVENGYFIVWTPYASLYHHESASRGQYYPEDNIHYFCEKWEEFLRRGDPFYNPNLSLNHSDFRVRL